MDHLGPPAASHQLDIVGAVARNLATPRRPFEGSVRDAVLGTRCVTGLGEVIATGARVLKNAAGLDLSKAIAGSMGAYAFLSEVTLRVVPLADLDQTSIFADVATEDFPAQTVKLMQAGWHITGAAHLSAQVAGALGFDPLPAMVLRTISTFEGQEPGELKTLNSLPQGDGLRLWNKISFTGVIDAASQALIT